MFCSPEIPCSRCGRIIPEGEPYWSLCRVREVMVKGEIEVQDALTLAQLCANCSSDDPTLYEFVRDPGGVSPDP
jgi:hypothetical protein